MRRPKFLSRTSKAAWPWFAPEMAKARSAVGLKVPYQCLTGSGVLAVAPARFDCSLVRLTVGFQNDARNTSDDIEVAKKAGVVVDAGHGGGEGRR